MRISDWSSDVCSSDLHLPGEIERSRAGGAVVVDVDDGNAGTSHPVDRRLTRGGIGVDVAGISLLDLIISYTRVGERETDRLLGHHVQVLAVPWLGEGDHPHACTTHQIGRASRRERVSQSV